VDTPFAYSAQAATTSQSAQAVYIGEGGIGGNNTPKTILEKTNTSIFWTCSSTGTKEFADGAAEYLKVSPEVAEESFKSIGKITPLGKYTVIQACEDLEEDPGVKSIVCFGTCEQIRNMCSLVYFRRTDMYAVLAPFGPSCATLVTYPAGMGEKVPRNSVFIGPLDPTGNSWFPPNYMALGIPVQIARQMSQDLEESFIVKRPKTAYPDRREKIGTVVK